MDEHTNSPVIIINIDSLNNLDKGLRTLAEIQYVEFGKMVEIE